MEIGVLFADLRGFTFESESRTPAEVSIELRRFYAHAEKVFLPEAVIDKLIGDEVMALYLPMLLAPASAQIDDGVRQHIAHVMLEHSRELLERVGYGSLTGPAFQIGIGLDFGEAFIGNIGDTAVLDFTAVGDVVNVASRLTGQAGAGEIVLSERVASRLSAPLGERVELGLKGKAVPEPAYRIDALDRRTRAPHPG